MTKKYSQKLTAAINRKGVFYIDSVKGCKFGILKYGANGCYGLCYAAKTAARYGYNFGFSVSRNIIGDISGILNMLKKHKLGWFRIGVFGDPCYDWGLTAHVCKLFWPVKIPIVVTKHWLRVPDNVISDLRSCGVIFNTSISALDTKKEIRKRLYEFNRISDSGIKSILRIVSCDFGRTENGKRLNDIQENLFMNKNIIDNPLRIPKTDSRVISGDIIVKDVMDLNSVASVSMFNNKTYIGHCDDCPDQCGINI